MAAKHDAKKARGNYWVMQQNMAKWKGNQFWLSKPKSAVLTKPEATAHSGSLLDELVGEDTAPSKV